MVSSTSLSKRKSQAAQHSLGPSALPLSWEPGRCLLRPSPSQHLFAIAWEEDRSFCAAFHHSQAEGHGEGQRVLVQHLEQVCLGWGTGRETFGGQMDY